MTTYFVSNAGSNTSPYDTEAKAATAISTVLALLTSADICKVSSTHTETAGAALTLTLPAAYGAQILSVTFDGSGTGGLAAGGIVQIGAANAAVTILGHGYVYGLSLKGGTNNNAACDCNVGVNNAATTAGTNLVLESCSLFAPSASTTAQIQIGGNAGTANRPVRIKLVNCTANNGANKSILFTGAADIEIINLTLAGTAPTTVFSPTQGMAAIRINASNLTAVAWTNLFDASGLCTSNVVVQGCILRSGFTLTTGTIAGPNTFDMEVIDCNSGDVNYYYARVNWAGTITATNSIYADATDGSGDFVSLTMASTANASFSWPLISPDMTYSNLDVTSTITTTVQVASDNVTFKNNELWQETLAKRTTGFPLGTWDYSNRAADILTAGGNQASSTQTWTGVPGTPSIQQLQTGNESPQETGPIMIQAKLAKATATAYVSPKILTTSAKQWLNPEGTYINEAFQQGKLVGDSGGLVA